MRMTRHKRSTILSMTTVPNEISTGILIKFIKVITPGDLSAAWNNKVNQISDHQRQEAFIEGCILTKRQ